MKIKLGIGFSNKENAVLAAESAAEQAKQQLGEDRIDIAFLLSTPHYPPQHILPIVENTLNHTRIVGGTTTGIILNDGLKRHGIAVLALNSDTIKLHPIHALHLNLKDKTDAGQSLIKDALLHLGQKEQRLVLFFFDGLLENMSHFLKGIEKELGPIFPIAAAGTSDQLLFSKTFQYHDTAASTASISGVIVGGETTIYMSRAHGWKPLGKPRLIQKARENIIETISHAPAIQLYEDFFKDNTGALKNDTFGKLNARYPLGIFLRPKQEYLIRNVFAILEDGSLVCQDETAQGSEVHIMIGNKTSCLKSAEDAANDMRKRLKKEHPQLLLVFESAMRWQILKYSWDDEFKIIKNSLGTDTPIFGMLTYNEIFNSGAVTSVEKNSVLSGNIILTAIV